jgi:hypothetical protein
MRCFRRRARLPSRHFALSKRKPPEGAAGDISAFRLSRIFAEGWNAAHKLSSGESAGLDRDKMNTLNPYAADPERARWNEGFSSAFKK